MESPSPHPTPPAPVKLSLQSVFLRGKCLISLESLCYIVDHILVPFLSCLCLICLTFKKKNTSRLGSKSSHHRSTNARTAQVKSRKVETLSCWKCFSKKKKKNSAVRVCITVSREGWFSQMAQRREGVPVASECVPWSWSHEWHWGPLPKPKKWEDIGTFVCSPRADGLKDWAPVWWRYWASLKVASWTSPWEGIKPFGGGGVRSCGTGLLYQYELVKAKFNFHNLVPYLPLPPSCTCPATVSQHTQGTLWASETLFPY